MTGSMDPSFIRNFCIIAHIDHGKSTLADQLLLKTGVIDSRTFQNQILDSMDLERERGITIKASAVTLPYRRGNESYRLNLIDTPGHVDFGYEVSRALAACEGALLVVDASQSVEAQTMANFYKAKEAGLAIIPIINKVDMANARPDEVAEEMEGTFGFPAEEILRASAKKGIGIEEILEAVVEKIPPPAGDPAGALRALVFDSVFDSYKGVIQYVRVVDGEINPRAKVRLMQSGRTCEVLEIGRFAPKAVPADRLGTGDVGYLAANIKNLSDVKIGDTVADAARVESTRPLPGYREPQPMVFCGLYPSESSDFEKLRAALEKLHLNDASFIFEPETSTALGFGFRCGFLGLLHMEIVQERLERESDLDLVQTAPNVTYELLLSDKKTVRVSNPSDIPDAGKILEFREPIVTTKLIIPTWAIGAVMRLCEERRGKFVKTDYLGRDRVIEIFDMPLAEIVFDFFDRLKSVTKGYGTMDYDEPVYMPEDLVKVDILVNADPVDALSTVCHRDEADRRGRALLVKLREEIPRHLFEIPLQAAVGAKIIARETIRAMAKNVTAKCYGGDITRKRKLWEKQKEGKKRMKNVGRVQIPQEAFRSVLSTSGRGEGE